MESLNLMPSFGRGTAQGAGCRMRGSHGECGAVFMGGRQSSYAVLTTNCYWGWSSREEAQIAVQLVAVAIAVLLISIVTIS